MKSTIVYEGKKRFVAQCENQKLVFVLPLGFGGEGKGITPPQAFAVSLAACTGFYALIY